MAIVRDAISNGIINPGTSLTVSHINAGNLLIAGIGVGSLSDIVTGVTYNGVAMTRIPTNGFQALGGGAAAAAYMYYLLNPAIGTFDIVVSISVSKLIQGYNVSYKSVLQSGQPDASAKSSGAAVTSLANTLTTIADNSVHVVMYYTDTAVLDSITGGTIATGQIGESNPLLITPAGSNTMTGVTSASQNWASVGASFSPAPPVVPGGSRPYSYFM